MRLARAILSALLGAGALLGGCSSAGSPGQDGGASSCKDELRACPAVVPSYATVVAPILKDSCVVCHSPQGGYGFDEVTYMEVANQRAAILTQVNDCMMPPVNFPPLGASERQALLDWLSCGAPNN